MSSILKALKKIEDQSIEENAALVWPDTVGAKKHEILSKKRKKYIMLLLIPAVVLALAGIYAFKDSLSSNKTDDAPLNIAVAKPEKNISPPFSQKDLTAKTSDSPKPKNIEENVKLKKVQMETNGISEKKIEEDEESSSIEERDDITAKTVIEEAPSVAQDKPSKPVMKAPSLKQIEDSRIDLQAIAWAPHSKDSFVVINNRIIREGNSIEGITILQIEKDTVSFQEGSSKWQQKFRIR